MTTTTPRRTTPTPPQDVGAPGRTPSPAHDVNAPAPASTPSQSADTTTRTLNPQRSADATSPQGTLNPRRSADAASPQGTLSPRQSADATSSQGTRSPRRTSGGPRRALSPRRARAVSRFVHLLVGAAVMAVVYSPPPVMEAVRLWLQLVLMPLLGITGVVLWQQARIRRLSARLGRLVRKEVS